MTDRKLSVARLLADYHYAAEPNLSQVFLLEPLGSDDDDEPVKLLEIVDGSVAEDTFAIGFAPNPTVGIPYRSVIVEISPRELPSLQQTGFVKVRGKEWKIGRELTRSSVAA